MSFIKRAWLSVTRKKGKSVLLFFILLVVATLLLSGISIKSASGVAAGNLRKALGGGFVMEQDTSNPSNQVQKNIGNGTTATQYLGNMLTKRVAEEVVKVPGVKTYNAEVIGPAVTQKSDGTALSLKSIDGSYFANDGTMNSQMNLYGFTDSARASLFTTGTLKLVEGRHITSKDKDAILLDKEIADKNNLKLGDKVDVSMSDTITGGIAGAAKAECTLIGLFKTTVEQQVSAYGLPGELLENNLIMDADGSLALYTWSNTAYDKLHFSVKDPAQLESIVASVKKLNSIDWSAFKISLDDPAYQAASKPLQSLDKLVTALLIIIILVFAAVMCLLLTIWTKDRTREAGILMSMGISKYKILFQYIAEVAIIAVAAFCISIFTSAALAQGIGDSMLGTPKSDAVQQNESSQPDNGTFTFNRKEAPMNTANITKLKVTVKPDTLWWVFCIGGVVVIASVLVSSVQILRVKPKELLTEVN